MASSNIKLFDENKGNMLSDTEFNISTQRLNGLQTGVASSQLQNKAMYQASLMAYAIAQLMLANGKNANDTDAVSTFVNNLSASIVQKKLDKASAADVANKVAGKWVDAKQLGELKTDVAGNYLALLGGTMLGDLILNRDPVSSLQAATKQYVDETKPIDIIIPSTKLTVKNPSFDLSNFDLSKYKIIRIFGFADLKYNASSLPPKVSFNNTLYFNFQQHGTAGFYMFYVDIYISYDGKACRAIGYTDAYTNGNQARSKNNVNFSEIESMQLDFGDITFETARDYSYVEMIGIKK